MAEIDQFESVFKSADKTPFTHEPIDVRSALVVTDLPSEDSERFAAQVRSFLHVLEEEAQPLRWQIISGDQYARVADLLELVEQSKPDLICTYRNLHIPATEYPYSLGVYLDVLTQVSAAPVLALPHPRRQLQRPDVMQGTRTVMAITNHLTGDHHLVSYATRFTEPEGTLLLSHVEDESTYQRYINTIAKIPEIDTEIARRNILEQLLKEPEDYIDSCRLVLRQQGLPIRVEQIVTLGHHLSDYHRLVQEHQVNLLVLNTKDEDQLAMHGLAYPLSVELREIPLLLL